MRLPLQQLGSVTAITAISPDIERFGTAVFGVTTIGRVTSRPVADLAEIGVHVVEVPSDSPLAKAGITTSGSMGNGTLAILLLGRFSAPCCRGGEELLL